METIEERNEKRGNLIERKKERKKKEKKKKNLYIRAGRFSFTVFEDV